LRVEATWTWYFSSELIVFGLLLQPLGPRLRAALPLVIAVAFASVLTHRLRELSRADKPFYLDTAAWLDQHVPEGHGVAICCSPGAIGFFSHRPIFALDGLTGDYAFHERAARHGLYSTLRDVGVDYLLSVGPSSPELPALIASTARRGHGGESVAFAGLVDTNRTTAESTAVGLFSPLVGRSVGWLRTTPANLVGADFSTRALGLWVLEPVEEPMQTAAVSGTFVTPRRCD
jgi:hypothetical protein